MSGVCLHGVFVACLFENCFCMVFSVWSVLMLFSYGAFVWCLNMMLCMLLFAWCSCMLFYVWCCFCMVLLHGVCFSVWRCLGVCFRMMLLLKKIVF